MSGPVDRLGELLQVLSADLRRRFRRQSLLDGQARVRLHERLMALDPAAIAARALRESRLVVIDTETTGLACYGGDEIVSIAMLELHGLELTGREMTTLVNPGRPIPELSSEIHGIHDEDVRGAPTIEQVIDEVVDFIGEAVVVGHHINFDLRFLNKAVQRHLLCRLRHPWLDTMLLYVGHTGRMGHYSLEEVASHCGVRIRERHTARGDALAAADVFVCLAQNLEACARPVRWLIETQYEMEHVGNV